MRLRLSKAAEADLIDIYVYGAQTFGQAQAERYQDRLDDMLATIAASPEIVRERLEISLPERVHSIAAHLIIYRIEEDGVVHVLRIPHQREDWIRQHEGL